MSELTQEVKVFKSKEKVTVARNGQLVIYGCGGCGINMAGNFYTKEHDPICADIRPTFIDASKSNLRPDFLAEDTFILPNIDGSGKVRKENHKEIASAIKQILLQIEPGDFNVVVFSASGGSGSVIGPLLLAELLERKLAACCLVVGSDESIITAVNTLNTLKSLEAVSKRTKMPVVMYYENNSRDLRRSETDARIYTAITVLSVLASRRNREMDSKDISNWLNFSKTTTVEPQLALLEIFNSSDEANIIKDPISIASVYASEDLPGLTVVPEYHSAGFLTESTKLFNEVHYVISIDAIPKLVASVKETLDRYIAQRDGRIKTGTFLAESDAITEDGLVL